MDINSIFEHQKANSIILRSEPIRNRVNRLEKFKKWILSNKQKIRDAVFKDLHKSETDTDISEIFTVTTEINQALKKLNEWTTPRHVPSGLTYLGTSAYIQYEPKGVCLIIAPWNFPFNLVGSPLVSCLAAGNTAMIKPSEYTPETSQLIREMAEEVFESDVVSVIEGDISTSTELLKFPFDHIFFTGSTQVGKIVMSAAAKTLSSVTLELGGKSPVIVDQSADLEDAARKIVWGKFSNNGQTCIAPDYIFVHADKQFDFIEAVKKYTQLLFNHDNNGFKSSNTYSRIVSTKHADRLEQLTQQAVELGARIEMGGSCDIPGKFIEPTLLSHVSEDCDLWKEEIFGPILPVKSYSNLFEAIDHINAHDKPLSLYVFTKNKKTSDEIRLKTSSGTMCINDVVIQYAHPHLPFGGVNASGIGKSHGYFGFRAFSNEKSVIKQRVGLTNALVFYPPFNKLQKMIVGFLIRYF